MANKNTLVKKYLKWAATLLAGLFGLVWGAWLVVVPADLIRDRMVLELEKGGLKAEFTGFAKGLFYSLKAEGLTLSGGSGQYVELEGLSASVDMPGLIVLRPGVDFSGGFGGGEFKGSAWMRGGEYALGLRATGIDLSRAGLDRVLTGLRARGSAEFSFELENGTGSARLAATGLAFSPYVYMAFPLPLDLARTLRAAVTIDKGAAVIDSVALDGDGIYARLEGTVSGRTADLTLVLTPEPELEQSLSLFALLKQYEVTTGRYEIPIRKSF